MEHSELKQIYTEIAEVNDDSLDIQLLEALANNAVYVLSKMQQSGKISLKKQEKNLTNAVLTDMLNTLNKELLWAKEEEDIRERRKWFLKAKKQFLEDMKALFAS